MHELGIATGVLDSVVEVASKQNVSRVKTIDINVGKRAAIIDEMFVEAFNALKELDEYKLCSNAKINTKLIDGRDVYIDKIEVEEK